MKPSANLILYDDECPLCVFQMRIISWLDWFQATQLCPLSKARETGLARGLREEDLRAAIHCLTPDGRVYRGARCLRFIGMRLPLMIPFALILWLPGVIYLAERAYVWVSRNRYLLSRMFGCKEACSILPPRKRTGEESLAAPPLPPAKRGAKS